MRILRGPINASLLYNNFVGTPYLYMILFRLYNSYLLSSLIARRQSDLRFYNGSDLNTYL